MDYFADAAQLPPVDYNAIGCPGDGVVEVDSDNDDTQMLSQEEIQARVDEWHKTAGGKGGRGHKRPTPEPIHPDPASKLDGTEVPPAVQAKETAPRMADGSTQYDRPQLRERGTQCELLVPATEAKRSRSCDPPPRRRPRRSDPACGHHQKRSRSEERHRRTFHRRDSSSDTDSASSSTLPSLPPRRRRVQYFTRSRSLSSATGSTPSSWSVSSLAESGSSDESTR